MYKRIYSSFWACRPGRIDYIGLSDAAAAHLDRIVSRRVRTFPDKDIGPRPTSDMAVVAADYRMCYVEEIPTEKIEKRQERDTTNYFMCAACRRPCDVIYNARYLRDASACCGAFVEIRTSQFREY